MTAIEIGRGKSARRGYELDDVAIIPSRRTRDADDVSTTWAIDAFEFEVPLVTLADHPIAGALSVLEAESFVDASGSFDVAAITAALDEVDDAGAVSAIAVRPQRTQELLDGLGRVQPDLLFIRGRVVSAEHVARHREALNLKKLVRSIEVPVIAGGCSSYKGALHLMRTGAAAVIVQSDLASQGVHVPLATAIADVRAARSRHLDETGVYCQIIAAVPVRNGGDVAKAIVCGADAVFVEPVEGEAADVVGDLRRTMATCGFESPKEFQSAELVVTK